MDMPLNVNRSMILTGLRVGRNSLICLSVMAYQTVMPIPWEFIVLCAGMYWTQGHAGSTKIYPLPCSDKEFISACHAEPFVQTEIFGCGWMQTTSVIGIHFLPSLGKPTGQPTSFSLREVTKMKHSLQLQIGQLLWVWPYEWDISDRDCRKRILASLKRPCILSCDPSQILMGKVGSSQTILNKLAS